MITSICLCVLLGASEFPEKQSHRSLMFTIGVFCHIFSSIVSCRTNFERFTSQNVVYTRVITMRRVKHCGNSDYYKRDFEIIKVGLQR